MPRQPAGAEGPDSPAAAAQARKDVVHYLVGRSGLLQCNVKTVSDAHSGYLGQAEEAQGVQDERQFELGELRSQIRCALRPTVRSFG